MKNQQTKPTIVLLRGLSREQRHWGNFINLLQHQLPEYQVICLDTLGNGTRNRQPSPVSISRYSQDILMQLAERDIEGAVLVGLSLGAMVALSAQAIDTHHISQVIALNTSSRHSWFWQRFATWRVAKALMTATAAPDCSRLEQGILAFTSYRHSHDLVLLKQWSELRKQSPTSVMNALCQIIAAAKFKAPVQALVGKRVRFIYGKQDQLVSPKCTFKLANLLGAEVDAIDQCGHDIALDQPQKLAEMIALILRD
ncbi:alpha/beta fold hydrolase [Motilimonas eburnea]|uniref:alpha/beta fold hydrolase n=1 Tax=Motilimonas eburnea TaxID=1737488 RepID=UPI001E5CD573|nr:alpha/beta hydrolase [Motilimonas eburnea]MCE2570220.1 alpha/beta hydrolase [Motilimonas eburnea]